MIRVLPFDDYFHAVERAFVKFPEYVDAALVYAACGILLLDELYEIIKVRFIEFRLQNFLPVRGYSYIHGCCLSDAPLADKPMAHNVLCLYRYI